MILAQIIEQLFKKPATNKFPVKYMPKSIISFLKSGKPLIPPVPTPPRFRGKLIYHRDKCVGCEQCGRVCPANVIQFVPQEKKVRFYLARCTFCGQCVDICPADAIEMSSEFLLADYNKYSENLVLE
ncbi:MAG: 4Fe-4S binding protein [Candidatus Bipolaricaulia bacterium]